METTLIESKNAAKITSGVSTASTGSNQLYIAESLELELPEDTFRMTLDNFSVIGENVTIGERGSSVDTVTLGTPMKEVPTSLQTPDIQTAPAPPQASDIETPLGKPSEVVITPKPEEPMTNDNIQKKKTLLKLSLVKNHDSDMFVRPSPVAEIMSPARMLQYEIGSTTPYTPTMKRAAIDFDFFNKKNFDESFEKEPTENKMEEVKDEEMETAEGVSSHEETTVIVNTNTVRHEIGDGKYLPIIK